MINSFKAEFRIIIPLSLFIGSFTVFSCQSYTATYGDLNRGMTTVSENEYYDFINSIPNLDSVYKFNLESSPYNNRVFEDNSILRDTTLFSHADIEFLRFQMAHGAKFKWTSGKILHAKVISTKKIDRYFEDNLIKGWTKFYDKYGFGFYSYSLPLFSLDKKICIFCMAFHCGDLCGHDVISVYKKVDGNWILLKGIGREWIN